MSLLYALTGSFDRPGGNVLFAAPPAAPVAGQELPAARQMAPAVGRAERPLGPARWGSVTTRNLYRAMLEGTPYPVRAVLGFGANMLVAHADGRQGREALKALDFYAHADLFMNPTAELADVVLPVASAFEREGLVRRAEEGHVRAYTLAEAQALCARAGLHMVYGKAFPVDWFWRGWALRAD